MQRQEGSHEQAGADDQHHRGGELRDDQRATDGGAHASTGAAAGVVQHGRERRLRELERWHEPEDERRDRREAGGEGEHAAVDRGIVQPRDQRRPREDEQPQSGRGDHHAGEAAGGREHAALDQHLPHDLAALGAERHPDDDLAATHFRLREEEIDDVGARDQQDDPDRAGEDEHRLPYVAGDELLERHGVPAQAAVAVVLDVARAHPGVADRVELRCRGGRGDPRRKPRDAVVRAIAPRPGIRRVDGHRDERFGRPIGAVVERQAERRRHDADDFARAAVHLNRLAEDFARATEPAAPQSFAEHDHRTGAGHRVGGGQRASLDGRRAQCVEEIRRHRRAADALRLVAAEQIEVGAGVRRQPRQARRLSAIVDDLPHRQPRPRLARRRVPEEHQLVRLPVRQRFEDDALDDAEDRGVRADAEREREHGQRGESGAADEEAPAVTNVLPEGSHQGISMRTAGLAFCQAVMHDVGDRRHPQARDRQPSAAPRRNQAIAKGLFEIARETRPEWRGKTMEQEPVQTHLTPDAGSSACPSLRRRAVPGAPSRPSRRAGPGP